MSISSLSRRSGPRVLNGGGGGLSGIGLSLDRLLGGAFSSGWGRTDPLPVVTFVGGGAGWGGCGLFSVHLHPSPNGNLAEPVLDSFFGNIISLNFAGILFRGGPAFDAGGGPFGDLGAAFVGVVGADFLGIGVASTSLVALDGCP